VAVGVRSAGTRHDSNMTTPALFALVLSGGRSRRMQRDKATLLYDGRPQLMRTMELVQPLVARAFVSVRQDQRAEPTRAAYEPIVDIHADLGPLGGIHAALHAYPDNAWLILACDLPFLDAQTLRYLIERRAIQREATAYRSSFDGLPEPLCAIFEPRARIGIERHLSEGKKCPRALLSQADVELLTLPVARALDNINTAEEYSVAHTAVGTAPSARPRLRVKVRYFAVLREQAGTSQEEVHTQAETAAQLYEELSLRHGLTLAARSLRVALNDEFGDWHTPLSDGDSIVFLPPVAGG
jgi:molybdopterin-guanine dinucleotide biosynthesis protein A